jgi:hypothetical protein
VALSNIISTDLISPKGMNAALIDSVSASGAKLAIKVIQRKLLLI